MNAWLCAPCQLRKKKTFHDKCEAVKRQNLVCKRHARLDFLYLRGLTKDMSFLRDTSSFAS